MTESILVANGLRKQYDDIEAVRGISFTIRGGEIFSLLGPNGAGKTTTIHILSCLIEPTSGTAEIAGHAVPGDTLGARRAIGVVPQEIALYDVLSARRNLEFWGRLYDMDGKVLSNRIDEVVELVGLSDRIKDRISTFSGGMKRRINIAAGLLHRPQILFMDEPTVGIDPQSRRRILDMVKELRDGGMTILYTTHYMEEAQELSDRVGIIDRGELIALGTQAELTHLVGEQESIVLHLDQESAGVLDAAGDEVDLFRDVPGVLGATAADHELVVNVVRAGEALAGVVGRANSAGLTIRSVEVQEPNLEAVFLHLTGRTLRD
ncbi:MAG TPA: ATP-binding cassette domain-containing protein [Promineifilum sp.]